MIYWAYQLTSQTESPIQFRDYFKKRDKSGKQANGRENIAQKMAELHIRQKQVGGCVLSQLVNDFLKIEFQEQYLLKFMENNLFEMNYFQATSLEWLPVYVIYDTSVLEKHSNLARDLIFSRHFISVLPSFVLSIIDKMKVRFSPYFTTMNMKKTILFDLHGNDNFIHFSSSKFHPVIIRRNS